MHLVFYGHFLSYFDGVVYSVLFRFVVSVGLGDVFSILFHSFLVFGMIWNVLAVRSVLVMYSDTFGHVQSVLVS